MVPFCSGAVGNFHSALDSRRGVNEKLLPLPQSGQGQRPRLHALRTLDTDNPFRRLINEKHAIVGKNHRTLVFGKGITSAQPGLIDRMVLAVVPAAAFTPVLGPASRPRSPTPFLIRTRRDARAQRNGRWR